VGFFIGKIMKTCSECKIQKGLKEFCKDKQRKDGLYCICKNCVKEYHKENSEKIKQQKKEYYKENRSKSSWHEGIKYQQGKIVG
jgi:hypothetical protein